MELETYWKIMGSFRPNNSEINISFDLQNVLCDPNDLDDFLTTTIIDIHLTNDETHLVGRALFPSNKILESQNWEPAPKTYHYHYRPVWYDGLCLYWQLGNPPKK